MVQPTREVPKVTTKEAAFELIMRIADQLDMWRDGRRQAYAEGIMEELSAASADPRWDQMNAKYGGEGWSHVAAHVIFCRIDSSFGFTTFNAIMVLKELPGDEYTV